MADLADQLGWCSTSKNHLEELSHAITSAENTVNSTIDMLNHYSFSECNQLLYPLQEQYQKGSDETQKFIADKHITYLEKQLKVISDKINELGGGQ